ncbi:MAG: hemerythrin domain-containing protein [Bacteroidales bacterium]|jgi:hypothetical protein|nr:hemerythrin domain-containing protein [Bacteroidales bacterium]
MNIFDELKKEHKTQRSLANDLLKTEGESTERKSVWKKLKIELQAHANAEERNLYVPMLEHDKSQENARHSIAEHHEIDELIEKLDETDMSSSAWLAHFKNLRELVFHHLDEEEQEIFTVAGRVLSAGDKDKLGYEYRKMIEQEKKEMV